MRYEYCDYVTDAKPDGYKYKVLYFHHLESLNNESLNDTSLLRIARKSYYISKQTVYYFHTETSSEFLKLNPKMHRVYSVSKCM